MKNIHSGSPFPLGATVCEQNGKIGVNFAIFSANAKGVELCLFDEKGAETRFRLPEKTGDIWHGFIPQTGAGQRYGYRVHGDVLPFNPQKLLLDPYAQAIDGKTIFRNESELAWFRPDDLRDNAHLAPKSVVVGKSDFDWGDDRFPNIPFGKTIIYEAHVKGFTKLFPDLEHAGTYRALADKRVIKHLKNLGITAVELLPVHAHLAERHLQFMGLKNYWGYNTLSHFALERDYAADPERAADEFRQAIKALHAENIEVILDVVYNHTAEQDETGAMLCQRGIDNASWYWLDSNGKYLNWTGTGNALNLAQRDVARWAADSLRYWVNEFHIDGFRFDLGSALARQPEFDALTGFFSLLYQDPILSQRKIIVEAWDLHGYHLGQFPAPFAEWNGAFRDDMRRFWCGESSNLATFATRFAGSADIFQQNGRKPCSSLNFITAHDGFTLRDLVSYNEKHNEINGENNRDGHHENLSYNHGVEGETNNIEINRLRQNTRKALLATLLLANGTPMLLGGDELGQTQLGNNNAYCQDNSITWLNWQADEWGDLRDDVAILTALRREIHSLNQNQWFDDKNVAWLNADGEKMSVSDWQSHSRKAMQIVLENKWLICVNGKRGSESFRLPEKKWCKRYLPNNLFSLKNGLLNVATMGVFVFQAA